MSTATTMILQAAAQENEAAIGVCATVALQFDEVMAHRRRRELKCSVRPVQGLLRAVLPLLLLPRSLF